ncbi:MAG: hypothetical protein H6854_03770 [Rhodospirillales bacterium]|nr:hypothetical protein [Rhodospirillales bacterium]
MMTRRIRLLRENGEKVSINLDNPFLVLHRNEFSQPYVDKYRSISSLDSGFYKGLPYMEGTLVEVGGGVKPFVVLSHLMYNRPWKKLKHAYVNPILYKMLVVTLVF